jgi:hypothetical protein
MPSYLTYEGKVDLLGSARLKDNPLEDISNKAKVLSDRLKSILYFSDDIENKNLIFDEARAATVEYMSRNAFDILMSEALQAMAITEEYNYPLYIEKFIMALNYHSYDLIGFIPESEDRTRIIVDLSPLGDIDDWATAVIMARNKLKVGRGEDIEERSYYWFSKIYGPAREGMQVVSYSKKEGEKDITENFSGKYEATLQARFENVVEEDAPFWYLIENGNAPGTMMDEGGFPYPLVSPTHFISKSEVAIAKIFELVLYRFINKVLVDYAYALLEILNKNSSRGVNIETITDLFNTMSKIAQDLLVRGEPLEPIDLSKIRATMAKGTIRSETFTRKGKRVKALRGAGGLFVKSPIPRKNYKRK